jgi:hypothetical protein
MYLSRIDGCPRESSDRDRRYLTTHPKSPPAGKSLAFGKAFTDHMFLRE